MCGMSSDIIPLSPFDLIVSLWISFPTDTWTAQDTTGEKPPALCGHSLTLIEQHRAAMFGGSNGLGHYRNDTYLLDMETWVRVYTHTCNRHNTVVLLVLVHQQILYRAHVQSCIHVHVCTLFISYWLSHVMPHTIIHVMYMGSEFLYIYRL